MSWLPRGLLSSVGLKFVMAITGTLQLLFVLGHMLGNLQVFLGQDQLNTYAAHLQGLGGLLWLIRLGLFIVFALHVTAGITLQLHDWAARPIRYENRKSLKSTFSSRTMIWSGLALLAFVVYHLLDLTFGATSPSHHGLLDPDGRADVYTMVVLGFQQAPVAISYVVAMVLLWFHLRHGIASLFQSMGWNPPRYRRLTEGLATLVATVLLIGNVAMPLCVLFGVVGLPEGGN